MRIGRRTARAAAVTAVALGVVVGLQGQAFAAPVKLSITGGYGEWNADPSGSTPGDAIRACDTSADGDGIKVSLDIDRDTIEDRWASTAGHTAGYCSPWASGNIGEGTTVWVTVWKGAGSNYTAIRKYKENA